MNTKKIRIHFRVSSPKKVYINRYITATPLPFASFKCIGSMSVKVNENKFLKINFEKSDTNLNVTQKENKTRDTKMTREDLITETVEENVKFH